MGIARVRLNNRELSRVHLLEPTSFLGTRKFAWIPPAFANRQIFARNDEELVCASLAAAAKGQKLIPNPEHGDKQMSEEY